MYFIVRDNEYINMTNYTFRKFLDNKVLKKTEPTIEDWKIHLTTVFPEIRLKSFIELRGADGGPWSRYALSQHSGLESCMTKKTLMKFGLKLIIGLTLKL